MYIVCKGARTGHGRERAGGGERVMRTGRTWMEGARGEDRGGEGRGTGVRCESSRPCFFSSDRRSAHPKTAWPFAGSSLQRLCQPLRRAPLRSLRRRRRQRVPLRHPPAFSRSISDRICARLQIPPQTPLWVSFFVALSYSARALVPLARSPHSRPFPSLVLVHSIFFVRARARARFRAFFFLGAPPRARRREG